MAKASERIKANKSKLLHKTISKNNSKTFNISISKNALKIGDKVQISNDATFSIKITRQSGEIVLHHDTIELRRGSRRAVEKTPNPVVERASKIVASLPRTLDFFINSSWNQCKKVFRASNQSLYIDDLVMAKMKSYSPWAGRITGYTKDKRRAYIEFFGTHDTGSVEIGEIVAFSACHETIRLLLLRKTSDFHKSIIEIESIMGVSEEMSLLIEHSALK